jgi:hypothetical protein
VAKVFRLWGKKRGERRTGSKFLGSLGEAAFFATLFFLGSIALAFLVTAQLTRAVPWIPVLSGWLLWLAIVALASFILIGGGGVIFTVLQVGASTERRLALAKRAPGIELLSNEAPAPQEFPAIPSDQDITNSPGVRLAFRLPISESPAWQLLAATLFCLVWNGISAVLIVVTIEGLVSGRPDWWLTSFSLPFALVGIGAVAYFGWQLGVHTGIGPTSVEVSEHPFMPGHRYGVYLSQSGRLSIEALDLFLICEEEASYYQGTDMRTETRRVYEQQVFHREGIEIQNGLNFEHECELAVPEQGMHSFQGTYNAVQWKLVVRGHAKGWPDYERSFPVVVHPNGNGKGQA